MTREEALSLFSYWWHHGGAREYWAEKEKRQDPPGSACEETALAQFAFMKGIMSQNDR